MHQQVHMNKLAACITSLLLLTVVAPAHGDEVRPLQLDPATVTTEQNLRDAQRLKVAGIIVSAIGIGAVTLGAVLYGTADAGCRNASGEECAIISKATGAGVLVVGGTLVAVGIPLWAVGQHRENALLKYHPELAIEADGTHGLARLTLQF